MKKLILLALISMPIMAEDRLGPSDVTDYYLEPAISAGIASNSNSDDDNTVTPVVIGSLWYVKHEIDIGLEALLSDSKGLFVSGRYPLNNEWNLIGSIGQIQYDVDTRSGDYHATPLAVGIGADYQTEYGKIGIRGFSSETKKTFSSSSTTSVNTASWCEHHSECQPTTATSNNRTKNTRQTISVYYQYDF